MNADPYLIPLEKIDVSDPALHQQDVVGAYFKRLRKEDPVHYCADSPLGPYWSVTKYRDIVHVDTNHKIFSSDGAIAIDDASVQGSAEGSVPITAFIAMDPPKHDEQRKAVTPAVAPANLLRLQSTIRERTCNVLDGLPLNEEFDWVDRVSIELTTQMLATLFDFPFEERRKLTRWSDVSTSLPGAGIISSWEEKNAELAECAAYFKRLWQERVDAPPRSDLISMLAHSPATRNMSPVDFLSTLILLIVGGNDTTRNSMSGGVLALHENPQEFEKLKANPALVDSLVPEIIRWQSPIIYQARRAVTDTEIGGKKIRKGDKVAMWYLSGNRDEEVIERADCLIIDRAQPRQHVAFGYGIHRCMGNRLAELQLRILWEEILKRFGRIEVVGKAKRVHSNVIRGISSLPVRVHA
jgi:cytochrome P450